MDFNETESLAYSGGLTNYDDLNPVEYKYFSRIRELGIESRREMRKYSDMDIINLRNRYFEQYQEERTVQDKCEAYYASWLAAIKITEDLRIHINGESDPQKIAALACRAIYIMTNDSTIEAKMHKLEEQINDTRS